MGKLSYDVICLECVLESRRLTDKGQISSSAKVLLLRGQLALDTIPDRLAEAGLQL